jgi:5-formyltetrahydrofolate cyclo-ligase
MWNMHKELDKLLSKRNLCTNYHAKKELVTHTNIKANVTPEIIPSHHDVAMQEVPTDEKLNPYQ